MKKIFLITLILSILSGCSYSENLQESTVIDIDENTVEYLPEQDEKLLEKTITEDTPKSGGEINLSMRVPKTLNPLINEDYTVDNILKLIFEPLFSLDEKMKPKPNLVSEYILSKDGKTLTLTMKDGLTWQNGTSVTAKDVEFSLNVIKSNPNSIYRYALNNISSYSSKGNKVIINYIEPYSWGIYALCFPIIPYNYYNKNLSLDSKINFKPIGNGAYKFDSYKISSILTLKKNTDFKESSYIEQINVVITSDRQTDLYAFEKNITSALKVSFSEWGKLNPINEKSYHKILTNQFEFLGFNFNKSTFKNSNLRKAIAYAIPKNDIIQNIYLGNAIKTTVPINPNSWLSLANEFQNYEYSIENSIKSLSLANLKSNDLQFNLLVNSENSERLETAEIISRRLAQIGIKVKLIIKPFSEYKELLKTGDFDMYLGGIDFDLIPNFKSFLTSSGVGEGGLNHSKFTDARMDYLIDKINTSFGEEEFLNIIFEFQNYFVEQLPVVGIIFKEEILLTDYNLKGQKTPNMYNEFNSIHLWYIKEEVEKNG